MIIVNILGLSSDHCQVYFKEVQCQTLDELEKYKAEAQVAGAVRIIFDCAV